jgi:succinate dehydrogenase / fumarate reductase iron-sulfur subunit
MRLKIKRFDGENSKFDIFDVKLKPHMSVLEALFQIQDEEDSTLAFRYSCRGAVCGSCAMMINKKLRLACRTQVLEIAGENVLSISAYGPIAKPDIKKGHEILVEPLPNLPLIKDLIVDMKPFFENYEYVRPWFDSDPKPGKKKLMSQEEVKKVDMYAACILCGLCYGSCPVSSRDKNYLGPAALSKGWRFYADSRYQDGDQMLGRLDIPRGVWACKHVYRCIEVCPKKVTPTNAITGSIRAIIVNKMKKVFR